MFKTYEDFESHEHAFNTFFATSLSCAICLIIGGLLALADFFSSSNSWIVFIVLVLIPLIVFVAVSGESEFRTAYYKTWRDKITGWLDRSKILRRFAKQYRIKDWKTKLDQIEADGRWNFHADTNYMHRLTEQRDLLLSRIYQEYLNKMAAQENIITEANRALSNTYVELETVKRTEEIAKTLMEDAKSSGELYKQRQNYSAKRIEHSIATRAKIDAEHHLQEMEREAQKITDNYRATTYRVKKIFYARYAKYTESAIKKINRINGLKYTIIDMPEAETWVNNPAGKELK
ncbi:MAG: hypothetical protein Q4A25_00880 [Candidatus Saccharibacteria bacterium]|nr:hypothetical protein [Candidatus Saccharibacteria bacterium]